MTNLQIVLAILGSAIAGLFLLWQFGRFVLHLANQETQAERNTGAYHEAMQAIADEAAGIYGAARLNGITQRQKERLAQLDEQRAYLMKYGVPQPTKETTPSGETVRAK